MHLAFVRVAHMHAPVDGVIQQGNRLVVGSDEHIHLRVPAFRQLRLFRQAHVVHIPVVHQGFQRGNDLRRQQADTAHKGQHSVSLPIGKGTNTPPNDVGGHGYHGQPDGNTLGIPGKPSALYRGFALHFHRLQEKLPQTAAGQKGADKKHPDQKPRQSRVGGKRSAPERHMFL